VDVDDEGDVDEAGQRPDIAEVRDPQLVDAGGRVPATVDQVRVASRRVVPDGGPAPVPATHGTGDPADRHQPADLVAAE
jgi:hypothetical protein